MVKVIFVATIQMEKLVRFFDAVSEELGIQDEAIFEHEPPPPAPLPPSEVIPENPR